MIMNNKNKHTIKEKIICAGFGGQGIITMGKILANIGIFNNLKVTCLSSYGVEVRGGTANSMVTISSDDIASPIVDQIDTAFIMNELSLKKFESKIKKNGLLIMNETMINKKLDRDDIEIINIPFTDIAIEIGNIRVANILALAIYSQKKDFFTKETLIKVIHEMSKGKEHLIDINLKAVEKGLDVFKKMT